MLAFLDGGLDGIAGDHGVGKRHLQGRGDRCTADPGVGDDAGGGAAITGNTVEWNHLSSSRGGCGRSHVDGGAEGREIVEVGFEVLEVEGEVEDIVVGEAGHGVDGRSRLGHGQGSQGRSATKQQGAPAGDNVVENFRFLSRHVRSFLGTVKGSECEGLLLGRAGWN